MPDTNRIPPSHHPTRAAVCNAVATHAIRIAETGGEEILLLRSSRAAGAVTMTVGDVVELLEDLA